MEGYSVTEAASVLGVPTERVWELLARGVLSGVPDGETGMRVFLQPRPAPPAVEEPRPSNGGASTRQPEAEASPFRELLSEFRNLTERYGQALLALGESRGEVASLRSRVDLLEARFDLRLPMSGPMTAPAAAGWNPGQAAARPTGTAMPSTEDAAGASVHEAEPAAPRRRRRGQHRATDDFAEALARAEDPSPAELPGGEEAAAAYAALRDDAGHRQPEHADAALPRELPAAEPMATAEPEEVPEPTVESPAPPVVDAEAVVEAGPQPAPEPPAAFDAEAEVGVVVEAHEPSAEAPAEREAVVGAVPEPVAEPPADPEAGIEAVPQPIEVPESPPTGERAFIVDEPAFGSELEPAAEPVEPEPVAGFEPSPEPVPFDPEAEAIVETAPESEIEAQPATEPPSAVEAAPAADPEPALSLEAEQESDEAEAAGSEAEAEATPADTNEAEPDVEAGAEPSWDRDRYTSRIEEPDWIPEERPVQPPPASPPDAEWPSSEGRRATDSAAAEPEAPEPPLVGEPDGSTPRARDRVVWFGQEPERSSPPRPAEEDFAAEMEVASSGGHATRSPSASEEVIGYLTVPEVPLVDPPDVRVMYRATLASPSPTGPAARAYRRLRRIFPG